MFWYIRALSILLKRMIKRLRFAIAKRIFSWILRQITIDDDPDDFFSPNSTWMNTFAESSNPHILETEITVSPPRTNDVSSSKMANPIYELSELSDSSNGFDSAFTCNDTEISQYVEDEDMPFIFYIEDIYFGLGFSGVAEPVDISDTSDESAEISNPDSSNISENLWLFGFIHNFTLPKLRIFDINHVWFNLSETTESDTFQPTDSIIFDQEDNYRDFSPLPDLISTPWTFYCTENENTNRRTKTYAEVIADMLDLLNEHKSP